MKIFARADSCRGATFKRPPQSRARLALAGDWMSLYADGGCLTDLSVGQRARHEQRL
jgi:hypothetical protein